MKKIILITYTLLSPLLWRGAGGEVFAQQPADCGVKFIKVYSNILYRGGNPSYKPSGDTIAYQKEILDLSTFVATTEIYISDTGMTVGHCITCDTTVLPLAIRHDKYRGNTEYYMNGNYILFTSENENGAHMPWNLPGAGTDNDIFIMNNAGKQYWRMTNIPAGHGILHPAFSHDGTKLFWCEMYYSTLAPTLGQEYGLWKLKIADFAIIAGIPQISNVVTFAPRDSVWYESHSFSPNDQLISFTSNQEGSSAIYGDITIMDTADIGTTTYTNLTNSPTILDEHSHWSPDGNKISWMRADYVGGLTTYKSELWLMDANGANHTRLTHFTDSAYPEYIQDTVVTPDHYWSPDGKRIFGFVHFINASGWQAELYQLEFMGPCGMNPSAGISEISNSQSEILISPNPFTSQTTITFSEAQKNITIKITDILAREIRNYVLGIRNEKSVTIDLTDVTKGIYFVRITDENKNTINKKIVVQ